MASFFSDQSKPAPTVGITAELLSHRPGRTQIVGNGTAEAISRSGKFILGPRPFSAVHIASSAGRTTSVTYPAEVGISGWLCGRAPPGADDAAGTEGKLLVERLTVSPQTQCPASCPLGPEVFRTARASSMWQAGDGAASSRKPIRQRDDRRTVTRLTVTAMLERVQ